MATAAILHAGTDAQKKALLPALMSGDLIISLAISEAAGRWYSDTFETHATLEGGQWRINGHKKFILDGQIADKLIVAARTSDSANPELFIVDMDTPGVQSRTLETIDETRKQTEVFIKDAYAEPLGEVGKTDAPVSHVMDVALVCLANEMVGGAQHLLESAIEYAGTRVQFGRPIGSFQAIKHKCADMLMTVELAKSVAYGAAQILDAGDSNSSSAAAMAKACASDAYMTVARECIQIHGGIGFTWDHDTHLWFKRAKSSEVLFGDPSFHRDRYIELVSNAP